MSKPNMTICIPSKSEMCTQTVVCAMGLMENQALKDKVNILYLFSAKQSDLPKARSDLCDKWYRTAKTGDFFMFIDSDQTFEPEDILTCLSYAESADVVCGSYRKGSGGITSQPKDSVSFYLNGRGELYYGATGFMLISYSILDRMAKTLEPVQSKIDGYVYPFFYERIVDEPDIGGKNLWLSEDFSFSWLVRQNGGKIIGFLSPTIGHIIPTDLRVEKVTGSQRSEKSIDIYCGTTAEPWSPKKLEGGLGGSETAVIKRAKEWTKMGYKVIVYCTCDAPGVYDNVDYRKTETFNVFTQFDVLILWRQTEIIKLIPMKARKILVDLHDVIPPKTVAPNAVQNTTKFCVKSKYHASMLKDVPDDKISIIPNGGKRYTKELPRNPNRLIYASCYTRGLPFILKWGWPKIKKACPQAEFHIYYGWNGFDSIIPVCDDTQLYKNTVIDLMKQEGVFEHGRISQEDLALEREKSNIHYYVGRFQEIDCITVRESASLGAIPVVSSYAHVFSEKDYCLKVDGDPNVKETQERAADLIIDLMKNPEKAEEIRKNMKVPEEESWEGVAKSWVELF